MTPPIITGFTSNVRGKASILRPLAVLRELEEQEEPDEEFKRISQNMWTLLDVNTQAIMKKVALNPSVFWGFQYVISAKDPDTGIVLFSVDIGDKNIHRTSSGNQLTIQTIIESGISHTRRCGCANYIFHGSR
jgi:hypothetical protein